MSGLPFTETPSLIGAERAKIQCDVDVDTLAYFNDPQGTRDIEFESPFGNDEVSINMIFYFECLGFIFSPHIFGCNKSQGETKYITFEPDSGESNQFFCHKSFQMLIFVEKMIYSSYSSFNRC